jgi:hypothetical protein
MSLPNLGRGLAIGLGAEVTWGTPVARTVWFRGVSESMKRTVQKTGRGVLVEATGSRNRKSHYIQSDMAGGSFTILMGYEGVGLLLKHILCGTPTTTGSGAPYTHTFKLAAAAPTGGLTIEVIRGTGQAEVFEGCRITKAVFKIGVGGLMQVTCDVIAETSGGRVAAGTATYTANDPLDVIHHEAGTVSWNSNSYTPTAFELTIDNKFATRQLLGSKNTAEPAPSDFLEVSVKMDLEWSGDALNGSYTADDEDDLAITFTKGDDSITFTLHNAYVDSDDAPVSQVGVISESVVFRGQSDGTDEGLEIEIVNTQSSAVAA